MVREANLRASVMRLGFLAATATAIAQPAYAQTARHWFDIPAQAAAGSLQEFARQSGKQVLFPYDSTRERTAPRINGTFDDADVLRRLAAAAGLAVTSHVGDTITLSALPSTPVRPRTSAIAYSGAAAREDDVSGASSALSRDAADAVPASVPTSSTGLEEIVVTAQRRSEDLQQAALSVSVRSGEELAAQGRYSLAAILADVPGITGGASSAPGGLPGSASGTDAPAAGLVIRGIPSNIGVAGGLSSVSTSAAVYVDGVYSGNGGSYDIDRVEVLRGPQGTLYGRSATTGLVAIHTRDPNLTRWGVDAQIERGNYSTERYTGAVNAPLVDGKLALRVSGNYYARDGYVANGRGGAITNQDLRVKLLYQPSEDFSLLVGATGENNRQNSAGATISFTTPTTFTRTATIVAPGRNKYRQYWAEMNWKLGGATLTYLPAYRTWTSYSMNYARSPAFRSGTDQSLNTPKDDFLTQELRLASDSGGKLTWQIGALYYRNALQNDLIARDSVSAALINSSASRRTTTAIGGFGEGTYALTPSLRITGGLRYDYTKVQASQTYTTNVNLCCAGAQGTTTYGLPEVIASKSLSGQAGRRTFNNVTYKARAEYDLTASNLLYALTSTGVTPGDVGLTTGADGTPTLVEFKDETLTSYEVGSKNRFFGDSLQINGSAFYYVYGGYQVASINISPVPTAARSYVTLSAPARAYGGELELLVRPSRADRIGLNLSYTNAYFVDRSEQVVPGSGGRAFDYFFADRKIPGVTPFSAQLIYDHAFYLTGGSRLGFHGLLRYLGPNATAPINRNQLAAGAYAFVRNRPQWLGDLSATWTTADRRFMVSAYARNLGNKRYKTSAIITSVGAGFTAAGTLSDPRTYGMILGVKL